MLKQYFNFLKSFKNRYLRQMRRSEKLWKKQEKIKLVMEQVNAAKLKDGDKE